jgi:hypothetical protein
VRPFFFMTVPLIAAALYLIDKYQFDARYSQAIWTQANDTGQKYQATLKSWWHSHG